MLKEHPLFQEDTQQEVLKEIEVFHHNLDMWKTRAQTKCSHLFDEQLWELIIKLLNRDPEKKIGVKEARTYFKATFPKCIKFKQ
jgi:hypothetical protein